MATIQTRKGIKGNTYRVQIERGSFRVSRTFKNKKEAERFNASMQVNDDFAASMADHTLNTITLSNAFAQYVEQYKGRDHNNLTRMGWWCDFIGHNKLIGKVTRQHVKAGLKQLAEQGKSPATLNRYKAALSALFAFLCDYYDLKHNPAREVRQQREDNAIVRFLSPDELKRLLSMAKDGSEWERLYLLILLALTTGARRSNLIWLRWEDIDLVKRTAFIERTKNGQSKVISLTREVIEELLKFRQSSGYLFPSQNDPLRPNVHFDHHWKALRKAANIANFRFHDLRHSCASMLAMNGATLLEIADILGHKTLTMTQRYAHLCQAHKVELTDRVFGNISNRGLVANG